MLLSRIDKPGWIFLGVIAAACIVVPALNLLTAPGSSLHVPTYAVSLMGKYLAYAILALSLDLVWGYCGILSLGHGAFFALGGYAMGMYLMRQIGPRGVYGNPVLPDFMVFLNYKSLPWYWHGFDLFPVAAVMVLLVPGLLAFVFGWLAFRSRVTGVYLSIITQAMTFALMLAFFRNDMGLGGNNGLTDFKDILGFNVQAQGTRVVLFVLTAVALGLAYLVARFMTTSAFGKVLIAIRDAESRTRFLGYRTAHYKVLAFTVSAMMAGVAGALYVPQVGIINPSEFAPANSIEAVIWVAVGGRGTLVGAALGAVLVNYAKTLLTGAMPDAWLFALGALFVVVTLFLPKGILGTLTERLGSRRAKARLPGPKPGDIPPALAEEGRGS
ncbi:urea ABC transporter permease subunit UrtC [Methylobacterium currus]|uniref:urea ABC transporter permease subunit UrtC n=1 Tax=Methylobacterium currus TaxID=2051553 RepID=UPI001E441331|nr:urea ABC transporter permease subunit UrtC [Methylobacterium currus]UHC18146.1 urea ABC transporter permease subunit UrtC [Methylobacterium currus]